MVKKNKIAAMSFLILWTFNFSSLASNSLTSGPQEKPADLQQHQEQTQDMGENKEASFRKGWLQLESERLSIRLMNQEQEILRNEIIGTVYSIKTVLMSKVQNHEKLTLTEMAKYRELLNLLVREKQVIQVQHQGQLNAFILQLKQAKMQNHMSNAEEAIMAIKLELENRLETMTRMNLKLHEILKSIE